MASSYRFFNRNLRPIYAACPLPAQRPPNNVTPVPPHVLREADYHRREIKRASHCPWKHTRYRPPRPWTRPAGVPPLSRPFNGFNPTKPQTKKKKASGTKRKRADRKGSSGTAAKKKEPCITAKKRRNRMTAGQKRKKEMENNGLVFRTARIRAWPTAPQRRELMRCYDVCRYAHNWANECVREGLCAPDDRLLRNKFRELKLMQQLPYANTKETAVNSDMVAHAIKQLTDAYESNYAKREKDPSHTFSVKFRARSAKKTPTEVIEIEKGRPDKTSFLWRFESCECTDKRSGRAACKAFFGGNLKRVGGIRLQDSEQIIARLVAEGGRLQEDAKIQWDKRTDAFYFIYLYVVPKPVDPDPEFINKRIVATDPGCAPFQEWYSPTSGEFGALIDDGFGEIRQRCHCIDKLQGRLANRQNTPSRMLLTYRRRDELSRRQQKRAHRGTTQRLRRKLAKERRRLHGYVESAHYDAANFLLDHYDIVIQPILRVSELVQKQRDEILQRAYGSKMARAMCTWSHYQFRRRLINASARYPGRHVYETTEPGTSKTCTHCGTWNTRLRLGDKVFECRRCTLAIDRQLAGARNNFLAAYGMAIGVHWDGFDG